MTAMEAPWYDAILEGSRAMAPLEESSALPVYEAAARFVPSSAFVVDLGCGTGRFAELLRRRGQERYVGYDFSPAMVNEAARYCRSTDFYWHIADLREWEHTSDLPDIVCYVALEVLEHLDDDRALIGKLAPGLRFVFSVPNFWSESHVRRFLHPRDVFDRYGDLLDFRAWESVVFPTPGRRIHVFKAVTRTDRL